MALRSRPARIETVVDPVRLRVQLTAAAHGAREETARAAAKDLLHAALFRGRLIAKERLEDGAGGLQTAELLARVADQVIAALYDYTSTHVFRARNPTLAERFAVVAVGGYGRGELAPSSDIDLLFLRPSKQTPWTESVTEHMLYLLWDMALKVGHASRSIEECLKLAREDHTVETALLEARLIAGDEALFGELQARFRREVTAGRHAGFIAAKLRERDERHARAGASRYLVEPHVKDGKGGLRDLHTLFWLLKHLYGLTAPADYVALSVVTPAEARSFAQAADFLWSVRCHLHFLTGRAEERLTFDLQPELARRLGFKDRTGQPAVERFMKRYFLAAKQVGSLTRIICAKLEAENCKPAPSLSRLPTLFRRPVIDDPAFRVRSGRLAIAAPDAFARDPVLLLRLFERADAHDLDIHPDTFVAVTRQLRRIDASLREDPRARESFLAIAASRRNPAKALRLMNEAGVLGRFVPEFGRIVARTQFNMYHHFTVDEHTLNAMELIAQIEAGQLAKSHPLSTQIFAKIINRRALYLAMLFHDVGKTGGDQCEEGAIAAEAACRRLGLPEEEVELIRWLVLHHLDMSETAQRRDIGDARTVASFAQLVGGLERLRLLLVLTVADIRAVGPGVWNGWKGQLLRDLYRATEAALRGGRTDEASVAANLAEQAAEARAALHARLGPVGAPVHSWLAALDDAYWLTFSLEDAVWHAQEAEAAATGPVHVAARPLPGQGVTQVLVRAPDRPGLFAALASVLAQQGADVADARAHTFVGGVAFDVFSVQDAAGAAFGLEDSQRLVLLLARLRECIAAGGRCPSLEPRTPRRLAAFSVEPWVRIDNDASASSSVVEVSGRDRPGLLADLASVIADAGCSIGSAHIGAYGERVADVFYVQDAYGRKLSEPLQRETLRRRLEAVLREGEPEAPVSLAREPLAVAPASTAR